MKKILTLIIVLLISAPVFADSAASGMFSAGTANTTGAIPVEIYAVIVETNETYLVSAEVVAMANNCTDHALYSYIGLFCRHATGSLEQVSSTVSIAEIETATNWNSYFAVDTTNQTVDIMGLGAASSNINWSAIIKYRLVGTL